MKEYSFIKDLGTLLQTELVSLKEHGLFSHLESIVSPFSVKLGVNVYELSLFSAIFITITLAALIVGWYLRRFGKRKWLGYILSVIGFLPFLPIVVAGTLVHWLSKQYWKGTKTRSSKNSKTTKPVNAAANLEGVNTTIIDGWEQSLKRIEKLQ